MIAKLLTRACSVICLGSVVFGMTAAVAQEHSAMLVHVETLEAERLDIAAFNDPEGEVGNGTNPPRRFAGEPQKDVDDDTDAPMETDNLPEGEISNGTNPPKVIP